MPGSPLVSTVADPQTQRVLRALYDRINVLEGQVRALQSAALQLPTLNAQGQRLQNLASPQADGDAATARYVQANIASLIESFKGENGVDGVIDTTATQLITVKNGLITEIA